MNTLFIINKEVSDVFNKANIFSFVLFAISIFVCPPYDKILLKIDNFIGIIAPMILIILFSNTLNKEFEFSTYKYLYTGRLTRSSIVFIKFLSVIIISIILSFFCSFLSTIGLFFDSKEVNIYLAFHYMFNKALIFICFTFFVAPIAFFISIISRSLIYTLLILFIMFIDIFNRILILVANEIKIEFLKNILNEVPFFKAVEGFKTYNYTLKTSVIMICIGIVVLFIDAFMIERKDL